MSKEVSQMAYSPRDLEIVNHYANSLGQPYQVFPHDDIPEPAPSPIYVLEFSPPSTEYDWVYTTVGASASSLPALEQAAQSDVIHRSELKIYSRERQVELSDLLSNLSIYPFQFNTYFGSGHTVAGSPGHGVVTGSNLTEILLIHPIFDEPEFEYIHHTDGTHTQILFVIPLHLSERIYAKVHGYLELIELFGTNQTDTSDFGRSPVV